jgi:hypothetical protein
MSRSGFFALAKDRMRSVIKPRERPAKWRRVRMQVASNGSRLPLRRGSGLNTAKARIAAKEFARAPDAGTRCYDSHRYQPKSSSGFP